MEPNDNQELNEALVEACEKRDITTMNRLLQSGASVNARNENGNTLLDIFIHQRRYASFNASWKFNVNDKEITQFLLDNKADINLVNITDCERGCLELDLREACVHKDTNQIKLLLKLGASIDYTNDLFSIFSIFDMQHDVTPEITQIFTSYNLNLLDLTLKAICHNSNASNFNHSEPLKARELQQLHKAQQLLEAKASVNCDNGWPLFTAIKRGNNKLTQLLLEYKANVNQQDNEGKTPLLIAKWHQDKIISILLKYKANVNQQDNEGRTPLWIASQKWYGHEVISILVAHKADVNLTPHTFSLIFHSPLDNVVRWKHSPFDRPSTIQLLTDNGAIVDNQILQSVYFGHYMSYRNIIRQLNTARIKQQEIIKLISKLRLFIQPYACDIILPVD